MKGWWRFLYPKNLFPWTLFIVYIWTYSFKQQKKYLFCDTVPLIRPKEHLVIPISPSVSKVMCLIDCIKKNPPLIVPLLSLDSPISSHPGQSDQKTVDWLWLTIYGFVYTFVYYYLVPNQNNVRSGGIGVDGQLVQPVPAIVKI